MKGWKDEKKVYQSYDEKAKCFYFYELILMNYYI